MRCCVMRELKLFIVFLSRPEQYDEPDLRLATGNYTSIHTSNDMQRPLGSNFNGLLQVVADN